MTTDALTPIRESPTESFSPPADLWVRTVADFNELAALSDNWNALAGDVPFRRFEWLGTWWRHFQSDRSRLCVPLVLAPGGQIVGLAPWFIERSRAWGRRLRFLGSGDVCTDRLTLLARPGAESLVADRIADWLVDRQTDQWDMLDLDGADPWDQTVPRLVERLMARGLAVDRRPGLSYWRLDLPRTWELYLQRVSRSHRHKIRKLDKRTFASGRAIVRSVTDPAGLERGFDVLVDLHQKRWTRHGEPGCFASPRFTSFLKDACRAFLDIDRLSLRWIELDGAPVAADCSFFGEGVVHDYQCGFDPAFHHESPGWLNLIAAIRSSIDDGVRGHDFLRGDEPHKVDWAATPHPTFRWRIAAPHAAARTRLASWRAFQSFKPALRPGVRWARSIVRRRAKSSVAMQPPNVAAGEEG